jgi:hypothetical protein
MSLVTFSLTQHLRESVQISRTPSQASILYTPDTSVPLSSKKNKNKNKYNHKGKMSERTPLLSGSVNGPSTASLPSRRDVEGAIPSKEERIKVAEAAGALQAGKLP